MLYSESSAIAVLGALLNDTTLMSEKYRLTKDDFAPNLFNQIVFIAIKTLIKNGAKTIDAFDVNEFLIPYESQHNVFEDNSGIEFIENIKSMHKEENYEYYWTIVRKFTLLRQYKENGYNIDKFYDIELDENKALENLNKFTIRDIIEYYDGIQADIRRNFNLKGNMEEYVAGADFAETKERMKQEPLIGGSFQSPYMNDIFRGMRGFLLRSAKSGGGKTSLSIADICKVTVTEYYDVEQKKFIKNKSREGASLFINTEMDIREELDPLIVAWISNVPRNHIMDGKYEGDEEERVDYAGKILANSELYVVDMPEFTCKSLEEIIADYVYNKHIKTCCFDYVCNNNFVAKELSRENGITMREDIVLLQLTDRLKQCQHKYDISLITCCQTNGVEDNMEYPTEACLAGAKSQVRKTDGTYIMLPPTKKELEATRPILARVMQNKPFQVEEPNNVIHIVKGRSSKYPKNIKVFQYVDLGTARTYDLFCTNKNNEPIKVNKMIIEKED